jgi:hypothetical protein
MKEKIREITKMISVMSLVFYFSRRQHLPILPTHGVPPDWDVSPMEDFEEAYLPCIQSSSSSYAMELLDFLRTLVEKILQDYLRKI